MNKIHLYDKIISPLVTEKSTNFQNRIKLCSKFHTKQIKKS